MSLLTSATYIIFLVVGDGVDEAKFGELPLVWRVLGGTLPRLWTAPMVWWELAALAGRSARSSALVIALSVAANVADAFACAGGHAWRAQLVWTALRCAFVPLLCASAWRMLTTICVNAPGNQLAMLVHARLAALIALQLPALAHLAALDGVLAANSTATARCLADLLLLFVLPAVLLEVQRIQRKEGTSPAVTAEALITSARMIKQSMLASERKSQVLALMRKDLRAPLKGARRRVAAARGRAATAGRATRQHCRCACLRGTCS